MYLIKSIKRGVVAGAIVATAALGMLFATSANANVSVSETRDCDYGSVVYCGTLSTNEIKAAYNGNPVNKTVVYNDIPKIYSHFGISSADINGLDKNTKIGTVYANGQVWADGQLIGINAKTAGRTKTTNSVKIPGTSAYVRPPSDSFARPTTKIKIFIGYDGKMADWAVISSCGNPLTWEKPAIDIQKTVSKKGANSFGENRKVKDGDKVTFKLTVRETSNKVDVHNVVVSDTLPKNFKYVKGSIKIDGKNAPYSTPESIWLRTIQKGKSKVVTMDAVAVYSAAEKCGVHKVVNTGKVTASHVKGDKDTATVEIEKACPKPVYTCDSLSKNKLDRNKFEFTAKASVKNGAKIKNYTFDYGDGNKETKNSNTVTHTYAKQGTYNVMVTVNFTVDGKTVSKSSEACKLTVKVKPKAKFECVALSAKNVEDRLFRFNVKAHAENGATIKGYEFDFGDGSEALVTDETEVEYEYAKPGSYKAKVVVVFDVNGEEVRKSDEDCEKKIHIEEEIEYCEVPGFEHLPANDPNCSEPQVLPETGAGSTIGLLVAVAALGTFSHRALTLRRQ